MKRKIMLLIVMALFLRSSSFGACAETVVPQPEKQTLLELLTQSQDVGGLVPAVDPTRLPEEMPSVEGKPVLPVFRNAGWEYAAMDDLEDSIRQAVEDVGVDYIVLDESPVILYDNHNGKPYSAFAMDLVPTYITDIMNGSTEQSFLGTVHTVESVLYFSNDTINMDAIVYYMTSGGTFVRVYDNWQSSPLEYTLEEFLPKAKAFCSFIEYYQMNRNMEGDNSVGGYPRFVYFIEDPERAYENSRYRYRPWTERYPWALPGISCVALVTVAPLVFLAIHKFRKKREKA